MKHLYPDLLLTPSTYLCNDCYNRAEELVSSTDNEFTTDNEVTHNVVDKDEEFYEVLQNALKNLIIC